MKQPLHYRDLGDGEPLLLIHGMGSSGEDWAFQIPELLPHCRLIVPDLRGCGRSSGVPESIDQLARDLWELCDTLKIDQCAIAGFSMGGAVAVEMAVQEPARCSRLLLINAQPSYRVDTWRKWLEVHTQVMLINILGLRRTSRMIARRLFPHAHQQPMRDRVIAVVGSYDRQRYMATVDALRGWCAADRLARIQCPVTMLVGELDYTSVEEKRRWARAMDAKILVVQGSRHGTPFDSIVATNAVLVSFAKGDGVDRHDSLRADTPEQMPSRAPDPPAGWT